MSTAEYKLANFYNIELRLNVVWLILSNWLVILSINLIKQTNFKDEIKSNRRTTVGRWGSAKKIFAFCLQNVCVYVMFAELSYSLLVVKCKFGFKIEGLVKTKNVLVACLDRGSLCVHRHGSIQWQLRDGNQTEQLKAKALSTKSLGVQQQVQKAYKMKDKEVKKSAQNDKRAFGGELAGEAERTAARGEMSAVYKITKWLCG